MAALGAVQGIYVLSISTSTTRPREEAARRKWVLLVANVATLALWLSLRPAIVPTGGRQPTGVDFAPARADRRADGVDHRSGDDQRSRQDAACPGLPHPGGGRDVTRAMRLLLALLLVFAAAGASAEPFRLGVRADARPFVFSGAGGYHGFLYDMCRAAIAAAGIVDADVEMVPVTAADRFEKAATLDLLCDPTTLTVERAMQWTFTPIVFYANATALRRTPPAPVPAAQAPVGCDAGTEREVFLAGWIAGTTTARTVDTLDARTLGLRPSQVICLKAYATHDQAVRDICAADGTLSFYVGDADILRPRSRPCAEPAILSRHLPGRGNAVRTLRADPRNPPS